MLFEININ